MNSKLLWGCVMSMVMGVSGIVQAIDFGKSPTLVIPDRPLSILRSYATDYTNKPLSDELTQRLAAERLQMLLERALGEQPALVAAAAAPSSGPRIYVGYGPHVADRVQAPVGPESFRIVEQGGDVFLLGEIAVAGMNNWPVAVDRGVMHAVESFAEQVLGYLFLHSPPEDPAMFELGTVIPRLERLEIAVGLLIEETPVFKTRLCSAPSKARLMGLRGCSSQNFQCNHSYGMRAWERAYGKEHPEMFVPKAEKPSGEVQELAMSMQPDLGFLDYTEPKVLEERLKHLAGWFENRGMVDFFAGRTPNDTYITEEVPDRSAGNYRYNERSRALWNPQHGASGEFSAIWFDYLNRLSSSVAERWPEMRIATLAYNKHNQPPVFPLSDRIDVMLTLMTSSIQCKEPWVWRRNLSLVQKWSAKLGDNRDRLLLWEYGCWPDWFHAAPMVYPFSMQKWLQAVRPHVSGVFFELYGPVEMNFLMRRLWMRLLWNPDLDVTAEIKDICQAFYGPAGESMAAFYLLLAERYERPWAKPRAIWGQYYVWPQNYYGESYPAEVIVRLAALLEEGRRRLGMPAVLQAQVQSGSAVYVHNSESQPVPVVLTLAAQAGALSGLALGWDEAGAEQRLAWAGRLEPGDKLVLNASGQAIRHGADGSRSDVSADVSGRLPMLVAGQSRVFHFWHRGAGDVPFEVRVDYGSAPAVGAVSDSLYVRRLQWVRDPYVVFQPTRKRSSDGWRGFFVDASVAHRHLGQVPAYAVSPVVALPRGLDSALWADVPELELVMGKGNSTVPYEIMGYPADLRTRVQMVYSAEGVAVRLTAEGKPAAGEKVILSFGDQTVELAVEGPPAAAPTGEARWQDVRVDAGGWRGVAVLPRALLGVPADTLQGAEVKTQIRRVRASGVQRYDQAQSVGAMCNYQWSPPLGLWGDGEQGPGLLQFR